MRANSAVFALSLALSLCSCISRDDEPADTNAVEKVSADTLKVSTEAIRNLKLTRAEEGDFPDRLSLMGKISVTEDRIAVVPARIAGRTDSVFVTSGEQVSKGQLLASLFSPDFIVAREEYLQTAQDPAMASMTRKKLSSMGMSDEDIQQLSTPEGQASQNLKVRAPRSGVLLDKKAVVGTLVNAGDTLFTIADLSKVWFAGDVYPEDLSKVRKNQSVMIDTGSSAKPVHGKVSFVSPVIDPNTRTIKIRALMENPGNMLRADMYVKGDLILAERRALLVPKSTVLRSHDGMFCFRQTQPNHFQRVAVETAGDQGGYVAVAKGLKNGDLVVSEGGLLLDAALSSNGQ
jgi:Cu(I)/Ag(I) efflux system membrane fusion protein